MSILNVTQTDLAIYGSLNNNIVIVLFTLDEDFVLKMLCTLEISVIRQNAPLCMYSRECICTVIIDVKPKPIRTCF